MADFFTRLAERTLGLALTAQPVIAPMFAPEPGLGDNAPLEIALDEESQNTSITDGHALVPELHPQQTPAPLQPQPPAEQKAETSTVRVGIFPTHALNRGSAHSTSNRVLSPSQSVREVHAGTSASIDNQQQKALVEGLPDPNATQHILVTHEQHVKAHIHEHVPSPSGSVNDLATPWKMPAVSGLTTLETAPMVSLATPVKTPTPQLSQLPPEQGRLQAGKAAPMPTNPPMGTRSIAPSMLLSTRSSNERETNIPPVPSSSEKKRPARAEQRPLPGREVYVPSTPNIEVTIGRIEVRAIAAPTPAESSVGAHVATPPLMSLDDYLQRRAKGGRS